VMGYRRWTTARRIQVRDGVASHLAGSGGGRALNECTTDRGRRRVVHMEMTEGKPLEL
jgi:hypothetical protein